MAEQSRPSHCGCEGLCPASAVPLWQFVGAGLTPLILVMQVSFSDKASPPAANGSSANEAAQEIVNEPAAQES